MSAPQSTYRARVSVPRQVQIEGRRLSREDFYAWLWQEFTQSGLIGVHEGTVLSESAAEAGLETESWTIDAGEAPRERDWISSQEIEQAELYFETRKGAERSLKRIGELTGLAIGGIEEQKPQDWDAEWKASFTGVRVPPFWYVLPPHRKDDPREAGEVAMLLNPGAGFGTGTHETTQLCMSVIGEIGRDLSSWRVLDFGSGSGILSIASALLGASVDAVEIDPLANENALENARLNSVEDRMRIMQDLPEAAPYELVIANILKPVLLEFAEKLVARMKPGSKLILSGMMEGDLAPVSARYSALLGGKAPETRRLGDWRALVWK